MIIRIMKPLAGKVDILLIPSRGRHLAPVYLQHVPLEEVQVRVKQELDRVQGELEI